MTVDDRVRHSDETVTVAGRTRTFTVLGAPATGVPRALLLVFHGSRQDGAAFRSATGGSFDRLAEQGVVVAYLDGYRGNWNDARAQSGFPARRDGIDDVGFARAVIDKLAADGRVDPARVVALGYSNGGQMALRLLHEPSTPVAGIAVVAATMPEPANFLLAGNAPAARPVLLVHGTADRIVPYTGGAMSWWVRLLFSVGGRTLSMPETARYFAGHNGITDPPVDTEIARRSGPRDRTRIVQTDHRQPGRPAVRLLTVHGGGHTVPGPASAPAVLGPTSHDLDLAAEVARFFDLAGEAPEPRP
ncbi:PHB depolymerase family esterase [Pseudonocardia kongjuensis]|uniref:PHB depolymerase family esterase n=1 Tax=Pseudonocardia kongjuensis TaxID=102227 RepID=A0ABN1Y652_9PSEU